MNAPTIELGVWGQLFMIQVLLTAPVMGVVGLVQLRRGKLRRDKRSRNIRVICVELLFLALVLLAAREQHVPLLRGPFPGLAAWIYSSIFLVIAAVHLRKAWAKLSPERMERARIILPEDPSQMRLWVFVSAMAGITEECAYRGLAFRFLTDNHGSVSVALALCISSFAIAHAIQGWRAIVGTAVFAALMHAIVFLTGSLYLVIVLHAVYDLMVGVIAMPVLYNFAKTQPLMEAKA